MNFKYKMWHHSKMLFFTIVALGALTTGCLDPVELDIPKGSEDAFVINAKIVKGNPSVFTLRLTQLFNFTTASRARITAKIVLLSDENGNEMVINASADGFYEYTFKESDPVQIEVGGAYKLEVQTFNGRTFESTLETLPPVPSISNITYEVYDKTITLPDQSMRTEPYIKYEIDTELSVPSQSERSKLRWELRKVYKVTDSPIRGNLEPKICYVDQLAGVFSILIYDGESNTQTKLEDLLVYDEKLDPTYGEGQYFTVIQESLSKPAYEYWERVKNISERRDNLYADPPGKVASNFSQVDGTEEVFGYFYVTQHDTARVFIDPELVGNPGPRCPSEGLLTEGGTCGDQLCCDCLSVENSQSMKPAFWMF